MNVAQEKTKSVWMNTTVVLTCPGICCFAFWLIGSKPINSAT